MQIELSRFKLKDTFAIPIITALKLGKNNEAKIMIDKIVSIKQQEINKFSIENDIDRMFMKFDVRLDGVYCIVCIDQDDDFDEDDIDITDLEYMLLPEFIREKDLRGYNQSNIHKEDLRVFYNKNYATVLNLARLYSDKMEVVNYIENLDKYFEN